MQSRNAPYTLGLDIGIASVGAALLLPKDEQILALHVRTFDKAETAKEGESLNKIRRDARSVRRRLRRRAHRLQRLARLMRREGIIQIADPESFSIPEVSPWDLRAEGLDRKLSPKEWATVLYHLLKHRGFQSNRKSEEKADAKAGQMLAGVKANQSLLSASRFRTVGELAAKHQDFREAKRNKGGDYRHTFDRADVINELSELFRSQRAHGNEHSSKELEDKAKELLLARRPTLSGENLLKMVGRCTFEKDEYRAPRSSYRAERFVWLGKLNSLRITGLGASRTLTDQERKALIDLPFSRAQLTFRQARAAIDLDPQMRFNLLSYRTTGKNADKDPESETFFAAKSFHAIRKAYEQAGLTDAWQRDALDPDRLDTIAYALTCFKDDVESRKWLTEHGVEADIIDAVLEVSFDKFVQLSQKALKAILPHMEAGQRYDEAAASAGYHHSLSSNSDPKSRLLPPPDCEVIRNPVVYRALNQARKVLNALIVEYGPPAAIHIELARDLSKPFEERKRIEREQKGYQADKEKSAKEFESQFGFSPKGVDLLKWRLFREQLDQCPYCQNALAVEQLFSAGYSQIDHALPYSRSFDDSLNNKVVVHTACNQNKGNRTPFEAFGGNEEGEQWRRFVAWVQSCKGIRQAKRNRLLRVNFGAEESREFSERNLNDTRYICREFKRMVESRLEWHPDADGGERCVVLSGQLTSLLRARWGLLKVRENGDLHHAMDAAVIASAGRGLVQRMAGYSKREELESVRGSYVDPETGEILDIAALRTLEDKFPLPWPNFRNELLSRLSPEPAGPDGPERIRVSRAPNRRGLGAAHQETIRSVREGAVSAIKTPLENLKLEDIENIAGFGRDTALIDAIRERLVRFGGDGKKAFARDQPPLLKPSRDGHVSPIIRSVRLNTTQKSGIPIRGGIASNGAMLRVDIFRRNGKFFPVPIYVADSIKPVLPDRAVVAYKPESEWTLIDESYDFLFSLCSNDWVIVRLKSEVREGYFSGMDRSTGAISIWAHDRDPEVGKGGIWSGVGIKTALSVEKCHVDLLGRLHRVASEVRQPILRSGKR